MAGSLRHRIISGASAMTAASGWSSVTMGALAQRVGVSRQTIYNEIGGKHELAEAMILEELMTFLGAVHRGFDRHPDDAVAGVRAATRGVLELAQTNALLRAIVSSTQGGDTELLPLLTSRSESLLAVATSEITTRLSAYDVAVTGRELATCADVIVRVVLGHVVQPTSTPRSTADSLAWVAARMLAA